jgi:hypothetical protein
LIYAYSVGPESCFGGGFERISFFNLLKREIWVKNYFLTWFLEVLIFFAISNLKKTGPWRLMA